MHGRVSRPCVTHDLPTWACDPAMFLDTGTRHERVLYIHMGVWSFKT
ncbi:hypothetical protein F383_37317 [Gossypium arboreum]|uniref:Uncharacterized protein n=1 Tax=Gossypium arboreum TaxID=29729 RepID=A0A0B0MCA7_GOSAR|nr:hypothetical protein F383_37317 [Gossypium arboreum]